MSSQHVVSALPAPNTASHTARPLRRAGDYDPERRLSIHLAGRMAALVRQLAEDKGMRVSDVVKAAVASFEFLDEHAKRGDLILIEDANGRLLKVPWPPRSPH